MPKFTDKDMERYSLIKSKLGLKKCLMCDDQTEYIDYCCEGRLCSTECHDGFYDLVSHREQEDWDEVVEEIGHHPST